MSASPTAGRAGRELDAAFEDLLGGRGDEPVGLLIDELRGVVADAAPAPSAALRQLLAGVAPEQVAAEVRMPGADQAAAILAALPAEEVARRYRVGRTVTAAVVAGATILGLTGVAAAHDVLPEPAETVLTAVVNKLTPFHIDPARVRPRVDRQGLPAGGRSVAGLAPPRARLSLAPEPAAGQSPGRTPGSDRPRPDEADRAKPGRRDGARLKAQFATHRRSIPAAPRPRRASAQSAHHAGKGRHPGGRRHAAHPVRHRRHTPSRGHDVGLPGAPVAASGSRHGRQPAPRGGAPVRAPTHGSAPAPVGHDAAPKPTGGAAAPEPAGDGAAPKPTGDGAAPQPTGDGAAPAGPGSDAAAAAPQR